MTARAIPGLSSLGVAVRRDTRFGELTCAAVASGTSRLLVLLDNELPPAHARHATILDLFAGPASLGGSHYQSNKVAVLGRRRRSEDFSFHFYQVDPRARRLYATMECSNAASAAAVAAMQLGVAPATNGYYRTVNLATHQSIELVPPLKWWCGDWGVRFLNLQNLWRNLVEAAEAFELSYSGLTIQGHVFRHGNVFVMAPLPWRNADAALVEALAAVGGTFAARADHPKAPVKVMLYGMTGEADGESRCEATCFSEGQQHRSLPGSAAMAMSAFFIVHGLVTLPEVGDRTEMSFRFEHPSGSMLTRVRLARSATQRWEIASTSFETPVRLLMHGALLTQ